MGRCTPQRSSPAPQALRSRLPAAATVSIRRTPLSAGSRWGAEGCDIQWAGVGRCETRERARSPLGSYRKSFRHLVRSIWSMGAAYGHIVVWHHHLTTHRTNGGCDGLGRPRAGLGRPPDPPSDRSIPRYILVESTCDGGWYRSILQPLDPHSHHPWQPHHH